jgi:hypothetical protein
MIWTDESHIVFGDQLPATKFTREAKLTLIGICALVICIVLSLGSLAASEVHHL